MYVVIIIVHADGKIAFCREIRVNKLQQYVYKWKNHFSKMKGDVGMSGHEKERKQEDAYTKIQTHS